MKHLISALIFFTCSAQAKIKVVATLPDIAEVVRDIGGDQVEVQSLLHGNEDPHFAEARPDYILKVSRADVLCTMGLETEVGWLPKVLSKAGNAKVQVRSPSECILGREIQAMGIPQGVIDRSLGDVHSQGNPHFNLSPSKMSDGAKAVVQALSAALPEKSVEFEKNYQTFKTRMSDLQNRLQQSLKVKKVMEYHKEFTYFFATYKLNSMGSLEEKPGMPPSAARIALVAKIAKESQVQVMFATPSAPHKALERFTELSGVPVVVIPSYVQSQGDADTIEKLQEKLVKALR